VILLFEKLGTMGLRQRSTLGRPVLITKENIMNWDVIEGNWKQLKGKVQQQWGKLTDDDLKLVEGKQSELAGRLQERYGYTKEQAHSEIESWAKKHG
jgi:uncharacterized protein YjbJ (UPF0337 family)